MKMRLAVDCIQMRIALGNLHLNWFEAVDTGA